MFPGNGVHRGLRYVFPRLVGVSELQSNQQQHVYKARGIKVNSHNGLRKIIYKCVQCRSAICNNLNCLSFIVKI